MHFVLTTKAKNFLASLPLLELDLVTLSQLIDVLTWPGLNYIQN